MGRAGFEITELARCGFNTAPQNTGQNFDKTAPANTAPGKFLATPHQASPHREKFW